VSNYVEPLQPSDQISTVKCQILASGYIQGVSAKTLEPNNSVIFQRIFVKFFVKIHILDGEE
jgi:hypothetical protein